MFERETELFLFFKFIYLFLFIYFYFYFAAKLGDTKELEDFIADLDRTLASEYTRGV